MPCLLGQCLLVELMLKNQMRELEMNTVNRQTMNSDAVNLQNSLQYPGWCIFWAFLLPPEKVIFLTKTCWIVWYFSFILLMGAFLSYPTPTPHPIPHPLKKKKSKEKQKRQKKLDLFSFTIWRWKRHASWQCCAAECPFMLQEDIWRYGGLFVKLLQINSSIFF